MNPKTKRSVFFVFTVLILLSCVAVMIQYSGFDHEQQNVKNIFISIVIVLAFQHLVADPIKLLLIALDMSLWPPSLSSYTKVKPEDDNDYNRLNFLRQRLNAMRVQILITERYRNDALIWKYRSIIQDLVLHGKYFLMLTCVVLVSRDKLTYYNTRRLHYLFMNNHSGYIGLKEVYHLNQLFDFVESSLVDAFNYDTSDWGLSSWVHAEQNKLVGVVRLRQLRLAVEQMGWNYPQYTEQAYMPDWQLPHYELHYSDKYWRIYEPWIPLVELDYVSYLLLNFDHIGKFQSYPELKGYISLLARIKPNSMKILEFLTENHWLTYNTSVVFMDFTLYNADADLFSVCTLRVEQTPFGSTIPDVSCDTVQLIKEPLQMPFFSMFVIIIYAIVIIQFVESFLTHVWYAPVKLRKGVWYKVDLLIVLLNLAMFITVLLKSVLVTSMLKRLEGANKLEFLDFRKPTRLHMLTEILAGFLISITTMRLWKVLQFSNVFQLFNHTLFIAWTALAITGIAILIILIAFAIAFIIINGSNSPHFIRPLQSIVTALCFAFGYSTELHPSNLFFGGKYLGIIMYAALGFVVAVMLINVFMTMVHEFFTIARNEANTKVERQITFWQFLRVHYNKYFNYLYKVPWFKKNYKPQNRTVAENIKIALDQRDLRETQKKMLHRRRTVVKSEEIKQAEYRERLEYLIAISTVLNIQMEILERMLFDDDKKTETPNENQSDDDNDLPGSKKYKQNFDDSAV